MSQIIHNAPDVTTFAANVVVFLAAIAAAVAGTMSAVKKVKESWIETLKSEDKPKQTVASAMIMESTTLLMWSESNRLVSSEIGDLRDEMKELRFTVTRLTDHLKDKP